MTINNLILVIFCFSLLLTTGCVDDDDDSKIETPSTLSSNYSLRAEGVSSSYSDEEIGYDFCVNVSTRNIQTSKYYNDSTVQYEVILSPLNVINQPRVSSYGFYVHWNRFDEIDLSLYDAVTDIIQRQSSERRKHLQFVITDEQGISYSNSFFHTDRTTDIDYSSEWNLDMSIPDDISCQIYGERVGELNYSYTGFVYSRDRNDSLFVDHFDLQLFVPLSL